MPEGLIREINNKQGNEYASSEAFIAAIFHVQVLWVFMPCNFVVGYQRCRAPSYPQLQG